MTLRYDTMHIPRRFTVEGQDPFASIKFAPRTSRIVNPDGSVVFEMKDVHGPGGLVAGRRRHPGPEVLPQGRRAAAARARSPKPACPTGCSAASRPPATAHRAARPTPGRSSAAWPAAGPTGAGRAATSPAEADARAFFDETCYMLAAQMAAPNSPQWFNTGLHWAYGIEGPPQGHYFVDPHDRRDDALDVGLRASRPARLLHPVDQRRPRQRRRHHGPVGPRGPHLQVRLRHRHRTSPTSAAKASRSPAAASRAG